ncbi:MAG: hypothetical protein C0616_14950 [Desulfuromonas sp.]|nr:MAG: hypothetical protein C0616_14950 [Desulfuromonas sp.]
MKIIVGKYSIICRVICSALIAWPLFYRATVRDGSAVEFLILVLLGLLAGFVLFLNSLFCLFRYPRVKAAGVSLAFLVLSLVGFAVAIHYLPQFRM